MRLTVEPPMTETDNAKQGEQSRTEEIRTIDGVSNGKKECIADMYDRNFDGVYRWVYAQLGHDGEATKEVVQDVFMGALKSSSSFSGRSSIRTWLLSIASNKVADYYRKHQRRNENEISVDGEEIPDMQAAGELEDIENTNEMKQLISGTLDKLPLLYRQVLILKYQDDFSTVDIADVINRSPKSVENLLRRARLSFKNMYLKAERKK
jgi:RNA polymerase sigma-70 factor (ECF subfamily)